ncbi:MAG: carboxymuconolactone decarboxylase family protein [Actinomycetota bacterium]
MSEDRSMIERGLEIRREVLGDDYVNKATASKTEVQAKFQDLVAGMCWGEVWGREALSRRERSLMNIVMLTALNRPHEVALHVQGALNNGLTTAEVEEAILHTMPYCGIPAAIDAMRTARPILDAASDDT